MDWLTYYSEPGPFNQVSLKDKDNTYNSPDVKLNTSS